MMRLQARAFTLIELLVVMTILAVLLVFIAPAVTTILRGSDISRASEIINSQLAMARMQALTKNRQVEVRIYAYRDPTFGETTDSTTWHWRALQAFELNPGGIAIPTGKVQTLPATAVIDENVALSTILSTSLGRPTRPGVKPIPAAGTSYQYASFLFNPDGSTDFSPSSQWFLTVRNINARSSGSTPPANFATIQVDPLNGTILNYRP